MNSVLDEKTWSAVKVGEEVEGANLYGFVHDKEGNSLPAVSIGLNGHITATMLDGTFTILEINPGDYIITCTFGGYKEFTKSLSLSEGDNEIDITMLKEGEEGEPWYERYWWALAAGGAVVATATTVVIRISKRKK